jgi:hypothetical protein
VEVFSATGMLILKMNEKIDLNKMFELKNKE